MISESFKQDLLNRVDIVDVINGRVPLKKGGANWVACCPFHSEKSPSFTVSPSKQFYHCFGCGAHGNAIGFMMEYAGLGYVDAVRELAESVGMKLPEFQPAQRNAEAGPDLFEYMARAAQYYRDELKRSPKAIEYLKGRGLTGQIAARYGIGYAPEGWQSLEAVFSNYSDKALKDCGLVIENESGKRYDRFRDRIMFPILNQRGAVIGFGGRVLGQGEPKYLNSPETPLFEKGRELYGLTQARQEMRVVNRAIVVEGYMDVVALAQHGIQNAVATLGTATTPVHVQKLLKQVDEVVFCFDGDAAGRRAAWHALEVSLEALSDRKAVKFLFLPAEHDPDSYVREQGQTAFESALAAAEPLSSTLLAQLKSRVDLATLEGRSKLVAEAKPLLKRVAAPALQIQLVKALGDLAQMSPAEVGRVTDIRMPFSAAPARAPVPASRTAQGARLERELLRCLLTCPELASQVPIELLEAGIPETEAAQVLVDLLVADPSAGRPALIWEYMRETLYAGLIAELQAELERDVLSPEDARIVMNGIIAKLDARQSRRRSAELLDKIKSGAATGDEKREYAQLSSRRPAEVLAQGQVGPI